MRSAGGVFLKKKDEHVLNFFFGDSKGIRELITQLYLKCKSSYHLIEQRGNMLQEIEPFTEATRDLRKLRDHLSPAPPKTLEI